MIAVTTLDGINHVLQSVEAIADITSPNTRAAIQAAKDAGDWETYTPPEPEPEPPESDWDGFNAAIMISPRLNAVMGATLEVAPAVAMGLPSALAQVSVNGPAAFALVFGALCQLGGVTQDDRNDWAALAEAHYLPADFVAILRGQSV